MIKALDHVAVPMDSTDEMLAFYTTLGCKISEEYRGLVYSVCFGDNKINFHTADAWKSERFTLRGQSALPGCGDFCFVWGESEAVLLATLQELGAEVEEGPVQRQGGRAGGTTGSSIYSRDPDQNLVEFIIY
ncbi:MAG: hypothetical protein COB04_01460 [Gammaproteobacteria bacterium]|nr:MAG: hypothetical protein COB04_01460 [Gammaproteobacteria bacterium]